MAVMVSEHNEEIKVEGWGHVINERSMAKGSTESHPILEEIGLV